MAFITDSAEDYSKWKIKISGSLDKKDWFAVRGWTIHSTDPNFRSAGVSSVTPLPGNDPIPNVGDQHPRYPFLIANPYELDATDNPQYFTLTVTYTYAWNFSIAIDPLLQPPRFRFVVGEEKLPCFFDKDGNPIVNTAGDIFDPQPQDDYPILEILITRNESRYNVNQALNFMRSTNQDAWTLPNGQIVQPGQARMHTISQGGDTDKDALFVPVTYHAFLTDTDFNLQAVDQGFQAWGAPGNPTLEKIYNQQNNGSALTAISSPALLDGRGGPMVPGNYQIGSLDDFKTANPQALSYITRVTTTPGVVGLKFKQLKLRSFTSLGLV